MSISIEILSNIIAAAGVSLAAASAISVIKEWLNRKTKRKLKVGGIEIEISNKNESTIYNQIAETVKELKIHPKIFIIYPHTQKQFVKKLANDLSLSGINIWLDENELKPGDRIMTKIKYALKESQWVILVPTPEDRGSSWVYEEIEVAYEEEKKRARPFIIPLKMKEGKIPNVFADRMWADFSENYESGIESLIKGIIRVPHHGTTTISEKTSKNYIE